MREAQVVRSTRTADGCFTDARVEENSEDDAAQWGGGGGGACLEQTFSVSACLLLFFFFSPEYRLGVICKVYNASVTMNEKRGFKGRDRLTVTTT